MTISATTQGLKPGVCTSTNRPANPYDGMLIYETDTDKVAVYDSSAWVYKTGTTAPVTPTAPGLVRIGGGALSGSSTVFDNVFSSTYSHYVINVLAVANASGRLNIQMRYGSTPTTETAGYYGGLISTSYAGSTINIGTNNASSLPLSNMYDTYNCDGTINVIIKPGGSTRTRIFSSFGGDETYNSVWLGGGETTNLNGRLHTGFVLSQASSSFASGTVNIYGYVLS